MKKSILFLLISASLTSWAQTGLKGALVKDSLYSKNLENDFGENPTRSVSVYLPPEYNNSKKKYPVIYFLHGFLNDDSMIEPMTRTFGLRYRSTKNRSVHFGHTRPKNHI